MTIFCFPFHSSNNMANRSEKKARRMNSKVRKNKSVYEEEEDYEILLQFSVYRAEDIDDSDIPTSQRYYQVVFWVDPKDEIKTSRVYGSPNPNWDQKFCIELEKNIEDHRFLYLEILRRGMPGKTPGPGTSTGIQVVGRTRISLPAIGRKISGRFGLVKQDHVVKQDHDDQTSKAEGHIILKLEMEKSIIDNSQDYYYY